MGTIAIIEAAVLIIEKVVPALVKISPEISAIYDQWKVIYKKWKDGSPISEDEVQKLRLQVDALSAANAKAEDEIINGEGP
jgi:hypothetical protein